MEAKEKLALDENRRIRKFVDVHEAAFVGDLYDDNNKESYKELFNRYDAMYRNFASKHNVDKRNFSKLDPDSFSKHFAPIEHCV